MKNSVFAFFTLIAYSLSAQHSISGTFTPTEGYQWIMAYRLNEGSQVFVSDTTIVNGKFTMTIPVDDIPGVYRLVYALPQEDNNFDIIYNGKENIELKFEKDNGVSFVSSEENILLQNYFKQLAKTEEEITQYYASKKPTNRTFDSLRQKLSSIQNSFETNSKGLLTYYFIASNKPYIPQKKETIADYALHKKENYFKSIDFQNQVLQNSAFINDKVNNYVFTALPLGTLSKEETEKEVIKNITVMATYINGLKPKYKFHIYNNLWNDAVTNNYNEVSDFIYNSFLKDLATETNNLRTNEKIEAEIRLRLGSQAPEIVWNKGEELRKLSELNEADNYMLVFWSSTCGHCLRELPRLHEELKSKTNIKVIAIGLEPDEQNWKLESIKLSRFEHTISLGKWSSEYAKLYDIHGTPTYYFLDKEKRIIAKPDDYKGVLSFLEKID